MFVEKMISVLSWWTFWFYIFNVQRTQSVQIFDNVIKEQNMLVTRYKPFVVSKTCLLIPELGPCRSKIKMYYFEPEKNNCTTFDWGGCQGNGNRFDSYPDCMGFCLSKEGSRKTRPRYCALSFDYGFCFGAVERWYYDAAWKVCKTTIYSGCGGNKNNFYSQEQCDRVCRFGLSPITTKRPDAGGPSKVLVINPVHTGHKPTVPTTAPPSAVTKAP